MNTIRWGFEVVDMWRTDWVRQRANVAAELARGHCGGSYGDAALILCSCISALAAEVWPGESIDRKRFVELLIQYTPAQLAATRVSVPLLVSDLRSLHMPEATQIESDFLAQFNVGQVLTGDEVDRSEDEIRAACNAGLSYRYLRGLSYASLLYREVRCGYTHEGRPGPTAQSWAMTGHPTACISYVNTIGHSRSIHFHIDWIANLALTAAEAVDQLTPPLPHPGVVG